MTLSISAQLDADGAYKNDRHYRVRIIVPGDSIEAHIERPEVAIDVYNAINQQRESLLYGAAAANGGVLLHHGNAEEDTSIGLPESPRHHD
jgi:hypothetical protein